MLSLVLESSTERSIVALVEEDHCLYMAGLPFGLHQSRYLVPKIDEGLEYTGKVPKDLDFITVGVGPGSYTGIRVGATVAKTLSYASQVPLVAVSTLEGFIPDRDGRFLALIDAKMAGVYILRGERKGDVIQYLSKPSVCPIPDLKNDLKECDLIVGPSFDSLQERILEEFPDLQCLWEETAPDPIHLAQLAKNKYKNQEFTVDGSLKIEYLRE